MLLKLEQWGLRSLAEIPSAQYGVEMAFNCLIQNNSHFLRWPSPNTTSQRHLSPSVPWPCPFFP